MAFVRPGGFRILLLSAASLAFALIVGSAYFYVSFLLNLPDLQSVEDYRPPVASRVLDRKGRSIGEFYEQHRYVVPLEQIPEHTQMAFVAAEDNNFFEHSGIDYYAILRAAWVDLVAGEIKQGASTITMQLVKQLLLSPERKFRRKIREMILAKRIESRFSKDDILYLYLNQIYFGHGAWGIGEAAQSYFGKDVSELTVSESALLAGLPQRPSDYSPFRDPVAAETRRRSVIGRMLATEAIDQEQHDQALADVPVLASGKPNPDYAAAGYFTEEVRRYLYDQLGGDEVLNGGLVIETTLDLELQRVAAAGVTQGLEEHDRRYGYRGPLRRVPAEEIEAEIERLAVENAEALGLELDDENETEAEEGEEGGEEKDEERAQEEAGAEAIAAADGEASALEGSEPDDTEVPVEAPRFVAGDILMGVVTAVDPSAKVARVAFAPGIDAQVFLADVDWARKPRPKQPPRLETKIKRIFSRGDIAEFRVLAEGASKAPYPEVEAKPDDTELDSGPPRRVELYQKPAVEGALLSFDIHTGDVLAMVGGREFADSQFNRATQARRQPGSAFKPLIYAAALGRGYTPVSTIYDRPVVIEDRASGFVWRPRNYGRHFYGPLPMRKALAKSVNNATVHLFRDLGVDYVIDYARKLGIQSPLDRNLTLALGSSDVSLLELTTAYAVFPNQGRRVVPRFIRRVTNRDGEVLLENVPLGGPPSELLGPDPLPAGDVAASGLGAEELELEEGLSDDQVISEAEAFLMCDLLKAVVQEGTGRGVKQLNGYLAAKTGTTNDQADAWFIGFSPDITTGVWVGYDSVKLLGWGETGARAALPIWRTYMREALRKQPMRDFSPPEGIVFERIDRETGLLADANSADAYFQPFLEDTVPTESAANQMSLSDTLRSLREEAFQ